VKFRAAAAIAFVIGCSGPPASDRDDEVILRVSAVAGLSDLVPGLEVSGSSAAAIDLVYEDLEPHIAATRVDGARIILTRRPSSGLSTVELAKALRGRELSSARALDAEHVEAIFADASTASQVDQYQALGFDTGPFEIESRDERRIGLVRRGGGAIGAIELVEASRADEWRKLFAHEVDVIPFAASTYRAEFAGMDSVRVLDISSKSTAAIYFNVRAPTLDARAVRRAIAGAIRRQAIARIACGDPNCGSAPVEAEPAVSLPPRMSVLVPADVTTLVTAAKVLRHQLWQKGLELEVRPLAVDDIVARMGKGEFELSLLPLAVADYSFGFFLSPGHPKGLPMTGFASPEYDAAFDRGDLKTAQAILDRELPVTRLFEMRSFAAIDSRFCGDVTPSEASLRWLSELYPCDEGPPP
jgi:hypothetical protein